VRRLCALAAVFVLAGCGTASQRAGSGAPVVPDAPAPPIEAADEAPPEDATFFLEMDSGQADSSSGDSATAVGINEYCAVIWSDAAGGDRQDCGPPTPEQEAQARAEERQYEQAIRPAPDSPPRVVARLATTVFIAWRNLAGALCWETYADDGGAVGPGGPCRPSPGEADCAAICLQPDDEGTGDGSVHAYVLGGTVAAGAEALRVTQAGGATATYPLVGPTVRGSDARVFMLELGAHDWRKLELVRGGAVAATQTMPSFEAASEDCGDKIGPMPVPADGADEQAGMDALRAYSDELSACVRASGATFP